MSKNITVTTQVPQFDGFVFSRIGHARTNDWYLENDQPPRLWDRQYISSGVYVIYEKIEPPTPKQVLYEYDIKHLDPNKTSEVWIVHPISDWWMHWRWSWAEQDWIADNPLGGTFYLKTFSRVGKTFFTTTKLE